MGHFIAEGATSWGALHHQGYVYVGDMSRGLDVFRYTGLRPDLPDLTINRGAISLSSNRPASGELVTITARVRNAGASHAAPVVVRFTDDGTVIGERTIPTIPPGEERTASVTWNTAGLSGDRELVVAVDPDGLVAEQVESNNTASRTARLR